MTEIIVYTTKYCPYCSIVKDYLTKSKVKFKSIDVGENQVAAEEMKALTGQWSVPVTRNGDIFLVGFNKQKLDKLVKGEEID